jgi:hypothetical protein
MTNRLASGVLCLAGLALLSTPGRAAQMAVCAPDFSTCSIPENVLLQLPFTAIAGDVVLLEADNVTISDVFRIFNNVADTTGGTGLGDLVFLFSSDDSTPLPDPSTFSSNVVAINEDPSGFTHFNGNGTDYVLGAPEPVSFGFVGMGIAGMAFLGRRRRKS